MPTLTRGAGPGSGEREIDGAVWGVIFCFVGFSEGDEKECDQDYYLGVRLRIRISIDVLALNPVIGRRFRPSAPAADTTEGGALGTDAPYLEAHGEGKSSADSVQPYVHGKKERSATFFQSRFMG